MIATVLLKLATVFAVVALGWLAGRRRWLALSPVHRETAGDATRHGPAGSGVAPTISALAFLILLPALLFRTTARLDLGAMPWVPLAAFFVPVLAVLVAVVLAQRRAAQRLAEPAAAGVRGITATFGNTVQLGVPVMSALYGERGLALHLTIVSVHALVLLGAATVAVELALARARARSGQSPATLGATLAATARQTLIHPVVLPVIAGIAWNLTGWPLPGPLDEVLALLGQAAVPLCLLLIGLSLAEQDPRRALGGAAALVVVKLALLPGVVWAIAALGFGLTGVPLAVVVLAASLPSGANALLFSQRYRTLESETAAAVVLSTLAFGVTAPLWVVALARWA